MAVLPQPEGDPAALAGPLSASAWRSLLARLPAAAVCPSPGRPLVPGCQPARPDPRHSQVVTVIGQLLGNPETAFYAACALLLLAVAVVAVVLKPALGLWALAVLFLIEFATPGPLDTSLVRAGSTHIYPADAVAVVLLIATAIYLIRQPPPARIMVPLALAGVMFTVNLALGIATFGLHHAVNESREWLYLLTTTAFVVAAGPWTSRFWRPWFALALGAMGLAWLGVAKHGLHSATSQIVINGQLVDGRPLNSAGAAALAFALIVLLGSRTISVRRKIVFGAAAICTLIVVQQRTVWAVLAVAFLVWAAASLRRHGTARHRRLAETTAKHSTFSWRVTGWTDLLHTDHSTAGLLLGFRFGTGYRRIIDGQVILASPHSFSLATVLRLGLIGLVALAFLYWNVWKYRHQAAAALGITPLTVALLLIGLLVFSLTYQPSFIMAAQVAALLVWDRAREPHPPAHPGAAPAAQLLGQGR